MDATKVATAGVQPGKSTPNTGATGRLEKLHRLHLLKQQYRELSDELDELQAELFGQAPQSKREQQGTACTCGRDAQGGPYPRVHAKDCRYVTRK